MRKFVLFLCFSIAATLPTPCEAGGWGITDKLLRRFDASPGQKLSGTIAVINASDTAVDARFNIKDIDRSCVGGRIHTDPSPSAPPPHSAASWITLSRTAVLVGPEAQGETQFQVNVPANVPPGSYYAAIESIAPDTFRTSSGTLESGAELKFIQDVGYYTYILVNIGNAGPAKLRVTSKTVDLKDDRRVLRVQFRGDSQYWIDYTPSIEIFDADGKSIKREERKDWMLPGGCNDVVYNVSDLQSGRYKAVAVIDAGAAGVFGARATLEF